MQKRKAGQRKIIRRYTFKIFFYYDFQFPILLVMNQIMGTLIREFQFLKYINIFPLLVHVRQLCWFYYIFLFIVIYNALIFINENVL